MIKFIVSEEASLLRLHFVQVKRLCREQLIINFAPQILTFAERILNFVKANLNLRLSVILTLYRK